MQIDYDEKQKNMKYFETPIFFTPLLLGKATPLLIASKLLVKLLLLSTIILAPGPWQFAFASALSDVALSMKPGTWAELSTLGLTNPSNILLDGGAGGYATQFTNRILWDSTTKRLYFIGQAHQGPSTGGKFLKYEESTNTWSVLSSGVTYWKFQNGPTHSYNHAIIIPSQGKIYYRRYYTGEIHTYDLATDTWSKNLPNFGSTVQVAGALCYFPERNGMYFVDGDWGVHFYSFSTNAWVQVYETMGGGSNRLVMGAYQNFCVYNPVKQEMLFGGGSGYGNSRKFYKMDMFGTAQKMTEAPADLNITANTNTMLVTADPTTGKYLFLTTDAYGSGTFREYDSTADSWAVLPPTQNPPWFGKSIDGDVFGTVATAIPEYGVTVYLDFESGGAYGGAPKVWLYKHAPGSGITFVQDTTPPTTPTGVVAQPVSSSQIDLAWIASTDDIGVTGYKIYQSGVQIGSSQTPSYSVAGLSPATTYNFSVSAYDAVGNVSALSPQLNATTQPAPTITAPLPPGSADFQARCAAPGVVRCVGFDSVNELGPNTWGSNFGVMSNKGPCAAATNTWSCPVIDTTTSASGGGSIRFTIHNGGDSSTAGMWWTNFSSDGSVKFGAGDSFYIQWRQRFSSDMFFPFSCGQNCDVQWKQAIIAAGDAPGCTTSDTTKCSNSGGANELVPHTYQRFNFPTMYNSQTGSTHVTPFADFQEFVPPYDYKLQNARPIPGCLYSQKPNNLFPPNGNCFPFVANEWMTFQIGVTLGPLVGDEYANSTVQLWGAREGKPAELLINWANKYIAAGTIADLQKYGKIWFVPHMTNKDPKQAHPNAYTWYDELIISRNKIADPNTGGGTVTTQPPTPPSSLSLR